MRRPADWRRLGRLAVMTLALAGVVLLADRALSLAAGRVSAHPRRPPDP